MKNIIALTLLALLTACSAAPTSTPAPVKEETQAQEPVAKTPAIEDRAKSCTCVKMWMPVCGENKKTYGNSCEADCAGVKYTQGACKQKK